MSHDLGLILTIAAGLTVALAFGILTHRLRLSPIVGYLLAGVVVGPFTPGFVADTHLAQQLAELGVILLMFGVGLHFEARELLAVRRIAIPGALVQIAAATLLGIGATRLVGWSVGQGAVFGLAISVASTVVLIRVLADHGALHTSVGHIAVGWLLVEDLFTVLVLVVLPTFAQARADLAAGVLAIGVALAKVAALVAFTWLVGRRAIPKLLGYVARTRSRELFTLTVLVVALGIAAGSAVFFDASMALGAFLAGLVVGQSKFSAQAASEALPMRDAFAVLFFVAMGMLLDPAVLLANAALTSLTLAVVVIGKPLAAILVVLLLRQPVRTAIAVAVALAQIGEFSFILASLALDLEILPPHAMQALVAASMISITLNPFLYRCVEPVSRWLARGRTVAPAGETPTAITPRAVVVGYGPVGRTVVRLLREHQVEPTVIEMNHDTVEHLTTAGVRAVFGDASRRDILEHAGIQSSSYLIFAASGHSAAVVALARELHPSIKVISRASYIREAEAILASGADTVVTAEIEIAFAMAERVLTELGATADQVDRARDRIRDELDATKPRVAT